jgi:hypothetical protein
MKSTENVFFSDFDWSCGIFTYKQAYIGMQMLNTFENMSTGTCGPGCDLHVRLLVCAMRSYTNY